MNWQKNEDWEIESRGADFAKKCRRMQTEDGRNGALQIENCKFQIGGPSGWELWDGWPTATQQVKAENALKSKVQLTINERKNQIKPLIAIMLLLDSKGGIMKTGNPMNAPLNLKRPSGV
ncbi:MAG: hypothetical protein WCO56_06120 [Verrucomicrobiota bacterium]